MGIKEAQQGCPVCKAELAPTARYCGGCGYAVAPTASKAGDEASGDDARLIGQEVAGRYRIINKLGEGGMGAVYRAEQISLKRQIALKVLRPELSERPGLVRRFNAEAELAAKLNHPNTVTLYDFGQDKDGSLFIAMEFIAGRSLREILVREGPQPTERIVAVGTQICSSLSDAHATGIVHRDLKPDNVMLSERGKKKDVVTVLDFGIAKLRDEEGNITQQPMTQAGDMLGTPQYMAPEQIRGDRVDARTDIYALGIILYEMATARLPFDAKSIMALLSMHLTEPPIPPHQRRNDLHVHPALEQLIMRCLSKSPDDRPPTMDEVEDLLLALGSTRSPSSDQVGAPMGGPPLSHSPGRSVSPMPGQGYAPQPATGPAGRGQPGTGRPGTGQAGRGQPFSGQPGTGQPGTPLPRSATPPNMAGAMASAASTPIGQHSRGHAAPRERRSRGGLWAILAVLVLSAGGAGAYFAFATKSPSEEEGEPQSGDDFMKNWTQESPPAGSGSQGGDSHVSGAEDDLTGLTDSLNETGETLEGIDDILYMGAESYVDPAFDYRVDLPATFKIKETSELGTEFTGYAHAVKLRILTHAWSVKGRQTPDEIHAALLQFLAKAELKALSVRDKKHEGKRSLQGRLRSPKEKLVGNFLFVWRAPVYYFAAIGAPKGEVETTKEFRMNFLQRHFHTAAD